MCRSLFVVSILFIGAVIGSEDDQAKIRFYHNSIDNYTELLLNNTDQIFTTKWYDPSKTTVFFTHGFTGQPDGPAVQAITSTYLKLGQYNVALLNWEELAAMALPGVINSYMNWAVPNAVQVGADLSQALLNLWEAGLDLNKTHLVGHSLGAHVMGIAGSKIIEDGAEVSHVIALDPATGFDMKPAFLRMNPKSARVTVSISTDPSKYGTKKELGLYNFWPNFKSFGPVLQPGCPRGNSPKFSEHDFCSHYRAWQIWVDALTHPNTILGSHARNFRIWKKYNQEQRERNVLAIDAVDSNAIPGNYYLITAAESPYGLGYEGL